MGVTFETSGLSTQRLTQMIAEARNDDFKRLLQRKIDIMNGVDVKKEAEEEELQSTSKTKKTTTKTTTKSKKK